MNVHRMSPMPLLSFQHSIGHFHKHDFQSCLAARALTKASSGLGWSENQQAMPRALSRNFFIRLYSFHGKQMVSY